MRMFKNSMAVLSAIALLLLTACQDNNTSEISSDTSSDANSSQDNFSATENIESGEESADNIESSHQAIGSPLESLIEEYYSGYSEPEKPREPTLRYAKEKDKISKDTDYDAIASVCTDLYYEYGRLTAGKDAVLTGITDNENFKIYLTYMAQHSDSVEYTATPYLDNIEMTDYPEYNCVFVKGTKTKLGGGGASGEASFIVTVKGDRLYVADYNTQFALYNEAYRKNFSAEENHDFWENPEKYQPILDIMKNNP